MTSLLPRPHGRGTRRNSEKRDYVLAHLREIDYRTLACESKGDAQAVERDMKGKRGYLFPD